jgi:hypothetical protein
MTSLNLMPFPQHDPPTYKCIMHNVILGYVGEYFRATRALAPLSPTPTSFDTTLALSALHP